MAARVFGGNVSSISSSGGQGQLIKSRSHSLIKRSQNSYPSPISCSVSRGTTGERNPSEEGFTEHPKQSCGIFANQSHHAQGIYPIIGLTDNINCLRFQFIKVLMHDNVSSLSSFVVILGSQKPQRHNKIVVIFLFFLLFFTP